MAGSIARRAGITRHCYATTGHKLNAGEQLTTILFDMIATTQTRLRSGGQTWGRRTRRRRRRGEGGEQGALLIYFVPIVSRPSLSHAQTTYLTQRGFPRMLVPYKHMASQESVMTNYFKQNQYL